MEGDGDVVTVDETEFELECVLVAETVGLTLPLTEFELEFVGDTDRLGDTVAEVLILFDTVDTTEGVTVSLLVVVNELE
jgi:hypothetical protein